MTTKQSTSSPAEINIDSIVNTEKASRGVWLVKVPRYLSNVWENKSGEAIGRLVVSNGETTFHSIITNDTESKKLDSAGTGLHNSTSIDKYGEPKSIAGKRQSTSSEIPLQHKFIIKDVQAGHQSLAVLSEDKTGLEEDAEFRTGKLSIEGRIVIRAECQPPNSTDYMRMKVRQIQRVSQPKKTVQQMERAVVKYKPVNAHAEHMNKDKAKREGKAVRLEKNEVVNLLFHAFEKHQFYRQSDLQKITNQPGTMIREVLNDIGLYHENAPHKAMWELKPEYRNYNKDLSKKVESKMQK